MSIENYKRIVEDIKNLKIQGSTNVAISGLKAMLEVYKETKDPIKSIEMGREILKIRPTEPILKNSIKYVEYHHNFKNFDELIEETIEILKKLKEKAAEILSNRIEDSIIIFTHCHSSTVTRGIIKAYNDGKNVKVICTETRPLYQGRITAKELSEAGIDVTMIIDSAMAEYVRKADIVLIGADVITSEGNVINKIGSKTLGIVAKSFGIPMYSVTVSWKYDVGSEISEIVAIEKRDEREVWPEKPKRIKIENYAFSVVPRNYITGIISELGVFAPEEIGIRIREKYPELFQ